MLDYVAYGLIIVSLLMCLSSVFLFKRKEEFEVSRSLADIPVVKVGIVTFIIGVILLVVSM